MVAAMHGGMAQNHFLHGLFLSLHSFQMFLKVVQNELLEDATEGIGVMAQRSS